MRDPLPVPSADPLVRFAVTVALSIAAVAAPPTIAQEPPPGLEAPPAGQAEEPAEEVGPWTPDRAEPGSVEAIRRHTTAPDYLPESVAYVPESASVPSPGDVLGHQVGAPGRLSSVEEVHGYFRRLAEASPRVYVETLGTSEEGREILLAVVSAAANLDDLDRLAVISRSLADPRQTGREEARALAEGGKPFYYLTGGLHSTETGSPEMLMELAYRLAVSERPEIRRIRDEVVVLITPVVEVDGRDRMVEWYERHLAGRDLPWDDLADFASPPYWGHYAFHDNNRDGMQRALALTRAVHDAFYRFHPQVVHDLHESLPLLYISTGHGPYNRAIDPVTINEWTQYAHREAGALQAQGLPGVWTWAFWDGWWPGYLISVANNHNAMGRFYETFGNTAAETFTRDLSEIRYVGVPVTERRWYRPWPPGEEVEWSLRNNTNYMQAAVLEALEYTALSGRDLLENVWVKAERSLRKGREEAPYAWIFPPEQDDPARLARLVNLLREHRIEVHRLRGQLTLEAGTFPAGSYVVRMDQPYRNAAVGFLERQEFPADEPNPPYDDVAWSWPLLLGVEGSRIDEASILDVPVATRPVTPPTGEGAAPAPVPPGGEVAETGTEPVASLVPVTEMVRAEGSVEGFGEEIFLLADHGQNALLTARVLLGDHQVDAAEKTFEVGGETYPRGSWIVYAPRPVVEGVADELGLDFAAVLTVPEVPRHVVDLPRVGVVHSWTATQDAGWVRYTLDQARFPYELVSPDDLRRGALGSRFDLLLVPDTWGDLRRIVHGIDPAYGPLAYTQTPEYPSHGIPNGSEDITGGMGFEGLLELQRFVEGGGVLVALANAGTLAVDGGLVRRVDRVRGDVHTPGSELSARILRPEHPLAYGYAEITSVFRGNGPLWEVDARDASLAVVAFGAEVPEDVAGQVPEQAPAPALLETTPDALIEEEELELDSGTGEVSGEPEASVGTEVAEPAAAAAPEPEEESGEALPELVLSGFVRGEETVVGKPAVLDVPVGEGRVLLFAFDPLHRYLNHSDFRFVLNAILHFNDLP